MKMPYESLTLERINNVIDELLENYVVSNTKTSEGNVLMRMRRCDMNKESISSIISFLRGVGYNEKVYCDEKGLAEALFQNGNTSTDDSIGSSNNYYHPLYFCVVLERKVSEVPFASIEGLGFWSFGYSTWKGRVMNIDIHTSKEGSNENTSIETCLMKALVSIAIDFDCARVVFQKMNDGHTPLQCDSHVTVLKEWLTLEMNRNELWEFLGTVTYNSDGELSSFENLNKFTIEALMNSCCDKANHRQGFSLRPAFFDKDIIQQDKTRSENFQKEDDAASIFDLVKGLALFEKELHEVNVSVDTYLRDSSGEISFFHCLLLNTKGKELPTISSNNSDESNSIGMAFFYLGFNIENGRYLFLEDLFIKKAYRLKGAGNALMLCLAEIALCLGCNKLIWQALDWNQPALHFYDRIGAKVVDKLVTLRLDREGMQRFIEI